MTRAQAAPSFPPESFALLAEAEPRSFWFRSRNALVLWALRRWFAEARSILEIGCGTGFVLGAIAEAHPEVALTGAEAFPEALAYARRRAPAAELVTADARSLPWSDAFDVVCAFDVLEHIDADVTVLANMAAATRPGGGVLITVPQHPWLWSEPDSYAGHVRRYTRRELRAKLEGAGFHVEHLTSFVSLLLPVMVAARLRDRRRPADYDPVAEIAPPARLDAVLQRVMDAERLLITAGVHLPAGGSLLAIARV